MQRVWKIIATGLGVVVVVAFGAAVGAFFVHNTEWVFVNVPMLSMSLDSPLRIVEYEAQLSWMLFAAFFAGAGLMCIVAVVPAALRRSFEMQRHNRRMKNLQGELADLRNMAINHPAPFEDIDDEPCHKQGSFAESSQAQIEQ